LRGHVRFPVAPLDGTRGRLLVLARTRPNVARHPHPLSMHTNPLHPLRLFLFVAMVLTSSQACASNDPVLELTSPAGNLRLAVLINAEGEARYRVEHDGKPVLEDSRL